MADDFPHHPKILKAGPLAGWLWACGLAYANCYATDGFIPAEMVLRLIGFEDDLATRLGPLGDPRALALRLVEAGLWEAAEGGFRIHDFAEYQPSSSEVKRERDAAARRQAEYRRRRAIARDVARNAEGDALLTRESQPPGPGPARPGPVKHPSDVSPPTARGAFAPNERDLEEAARLGLDAVAISAELDAMFDHYAAVGQHRADWHATFRGWLRKGVKLGRAVPVGPPTRNGSDQSIYGPVVAVEGIKT